MKPPRLVIVIQHGVCSAVITDGPEAIPVAVINYDDGDDDDIDPSSLVHIPQDAHPGDGPLASAITMTAAVHPNRVEQLFRTAGSCRRMSSLSKH